MNPLLELNDVSKRYDDAGAAPLVVLKHVTLTVAEGESLAIVGPSGSGKSTLLNIIGALDRPSAGNVRLGGKDMAGMDEEALAAVRNRQVGFVFQLHHLLPQCTVLENVLVPTLASGEHAPRHEAEARGRRLLGRVGLADRLASRPARLSGGERQRVAVARALINRPRLLLADEPTGSLDRPSAENLADLLTELNREEGTALIVVTHSEALASRMGRVYQLCDGSLSPVKGTG